MPEIHNDVYMAGVKRTSPEEPATVTLYDRGYREIAQYETLWSHPIIIGGACVCHMDLESEEKKFWFCEGSRGQAFGGSGLGKAKVTGSRKERQVIITTEHCQVDEPFGRPRGKARDVGRRK